MKILVAIANYGTKNQTYLERLLQEYRSLAYDVDIVVLSDVPKDFGSDVEVVVGLPDRDPWSLPFGHKRIFADRARDYDLFVYSEDDTLVQQRHIEAFLEMTAILPADRIAGFLRYEQAPGGHRYCSTIHSFYHWVPSSVQSFGPHVFACFTNEHAACYMLTQDQLARAIRSGGFLVPPHKGRYDMLCTASTDPYTQCGFTKVICLSRAEDFLLHHLPNQYLGRMGLPFEEMHAQIEALLRCAGQDGHRAELLPVAATRNTTPWSKRYYEPVREDVLTMVPAGTRHILSVGCGDGATEGALMGRGARLVGIPLDTIIAESARVKGIELTSPDLEEAVQSLKGRQFDCILLLDILQHVPDAPRLLATLAGLLAEGGQLVITAPNFQYLRYRRSGPSGSGTPRTGDGSGAFHLHRTTSRVIADWVGTAGLRVKHLRYDKNGRFDWLVKVSCGLARPHLSRSILVTADRGGKSQGLGRKKVSGILSPA
jgi:SAM-dependent methyltransferase